MKILKINDILSQINRENGWSNSVDRETEKNEKRTIRKIPNIGVM